jgi:hypothetical protein
MSYTHSNVAKELGRAQHITTKVRKWPVDRMTERAKLLATREHALLVEKNRLQVKSAMLKMLSTADKMQRETIARGAMATVLRSKIAYFRKKNIPAKEMGKVLGDTDKVVKKMLSLANGGTLSMSRRIDREISTIDRKLLKLQ